MDQKTKELTQWAVEKLNFEAKDVYPMQLYTQTNSRHTIDWIQELFDDTVRKISIASSPIYKDKHVVNS